MNSKKRKLFSKLALCSLAMTMVFSAGSCGKGEESNGKIAVIGQSKTVQFWQSVQKGAEDAGEEMNYEIIYNNAEDGNDVQGQVDFIRQAINEKVKAIVIAPNSSSELNSVLQEADREGIQVVAIDADLTYSGKKTYIGTNNLAAGSVAGRQALRILEGGGKIAVISQSEGSTTGADRVQGFTNEIYSYNSSAAAAMARNTGMEDISTEEEDTELSQAEIDEVASKTRFEALNILPIKYCNNSRETAKQQAASIIKDNPDLKMFYGTNETSTLGICDAIKEAGKTGEISVIGFNSNDDEIRYIIDGTLDALVVQNPYNMGYLGVRYSDKLLNGSKISINVDTGVILVTPSNINTSDIQLLLYPDDPDSNKVDSIRNAMRGEANEEAAADEAAQN